MQASVHTFDETTGSGTVLLDDGLERSFTSGVFAASELRHLRFGQRVSVTVGPDVTPKPDVTPGPDGSAADGSPAEVVTRLWVVGIGSGEAIH